MKHPVKLTIILITMFLVAQLIGLAVIYQYKPHVETVQIGNQTLNQTVYNLPFGMNPPQEVSPSSNLLSMIIAIAIGVVLILSLMRMKAELFIRYWFFLVVIIALSITINSVLKSLPYSVFISVIIALPFSILKVFKRNMFVHNITELLIYPGIGAIIVPLLNVWTVVLLLVLISIYDIYAVWHAGFMQKMAKYQIQKVQVFSGFLVPYFRKEDKILLEKARKTKKKSDLKKVKVNMAILGGGDVVFPIILSGVVLLQFGIIAALITSIGATIALACLFYYSEKGRFYPAMPFISAGCLIALGVVYLLSYIHF